MTASREGQGYFPSRTGDLHRALASLERKLEAVDGYQELVEATKDAELRRILEYGRDREKEQAAMLLEWLSRKDADFAAILQRIGHEGAVVVESGGSPGAHRDGERKRARKKV